MNQMKPKSRQTALPAAGLRREPKYDPAVWQPALLELLKNGKSLSESCALLAGSCPTPARVLDYVDNDPAFGKDYAQARARGYMLIADEIDRLTKQTHTTTLRVKTDARGNPLRGPDGRELTEEVLVPLSPDVIAHNRLRIDTLKWMLSKMLPKIYGDKVTTEHTGPGGGPVQLAAIDMKNLSDAELQQMQAMLAKAGSAK